MNEAHALGCEGNHGRSDVCGGSAHRRAVGARPYDGAPREKAPPAPIGIPHRVLGAAFEMIPGVAFYFAVTSDDHPAVLYFVLIGMASGVGWLVVRCWAVGASMFVIRWLLLIAWFAFMWEGYSNDGVCYLKYDNAGACYDRYVTLTVIALGALFTMPIVSGAVLLWFGPKDTGFDGDPSAAGWRVPWFILVMMVVPVLLGVLINGSGAGEVRFTVRNESTDEWFMSPLPTRRDEDAPPPGQTAVIRPLYSRFGEPREVRFYSRGSGAAWTCTWDEIVAQDVVVLRDNQPPLPTCVSLWFRTRQSSPARKRW